MCTPPLQPRSCNVNQNVIFILFILHMFANLMTALTCFLLVFPLVDDQTTLGAQEWLMRAMPGYSPALAPTPLSGSPPPPTTHYTFTICTMAERSLLLSPLNVSCP